LRFLDQDYDESCEKATRPLESFSDDDLAYLIHVRLRAMQDQLNRKDIPSEADQLNRQLKELSQKFSDLERVNSELLENNKQIQTENVNLHAHLFALQQTQITTSKQGTLEFKSNDNLVVNEENSYSIPEWMNAWRETKVFERTALAILVMGDTGKALRPSITNEMAKRLALSADNNSLDDAVSRLMSIEREVRPILIGRIEGISDQGSSSGGISPDVLRLTKNGEAAYQVLSGKVSKENQYDRLIRCHSSAEHTILNIQAAEILEENGYRIKGQALEIQLNNGSTFIPDIIVIESTTGELIFIEVERDVHKDQKTRKQKWINLYEATNGNLYVFCDNLTCQRMVQSEINIALSGLSFNSFLTNLHGLRNGKRSEKGGIWLSEKRNK
jgi:regulator of replication initiation timing